MNTYSIGDIHGMYKDLLLLVRKVRKAGGLNFKAGDKLVQVGDMVDRGPDSRRVIAFFMKLQKRYPGQVICLLGNHEDMMIKNALRGLGDHWLLPNNGGEATLASYKANVGTLQYKLEDQGHLRWLDGLPWYYEDDKFFFCHAPVPKLGESSVISSKYRRSTFKKHKEVLIWSYGGENLHAWVEPDVIKGKTSFHGHIHGIHYEKTVEWDFEMDQMMKVSKLIVPGVRSIGNAHVIDTGSGCSSEGYLTCVRCDDIMQWNTKKEEV